MMEKKIFAASSTSVGLGIGNLAIAIGVLIMSALILNFAVQSANSASDASTVSRDAIVNTTSIAASVSFPCSKYRAFGTKGEVQGFLDSAAPAMETMLDHQIASGIVAGAYIGASVGPNNEQHHYEVGYANASSGLLFTNRTITRLLSATKYIGTATFLKFMSEHNVNGDDKLSRFVPEFASTKVLRPYFPSTPVLLQNAITTVAGSTLVTVATTLYGGIENGQNLTISGVLAAVDGIPASELNGVHEITISSPLSFPLVFTFRVTTRAAAGIASTGGDFTVVPGVAIYNNVVSTTAASNVVKITTPTAHLFETGDSIGVFKTEDTVAIDGIPSIGEINGVHAITVTSATEFTFTTTTNAVSGIAGTGGKFQIARLHSAVKQTQPDFFCDDQVLYYTLIDPSPSPLVRHAMEHSLGWTYGRVELLACTNFVAPGSTPYELEGRIQSQIAKELKLSIAIDYPGSATAGANIKDWAASWAALPLMFHPGEWFAYGPQTSILGAIIEVADASTQFSHDTPPKARTLYQYMKESIFDPLEMEDTFFFIQDDDPRRADLLSRMSEVYFTGTTVPVSTIPLFEVIADWAYAPGRPRGTEIIDTGLLSTPADLMKFYQMIRNGGKLNNGTRLIPETLLAEGSSTQNTHFDGGTGGYAGGERQRGKHATWGYGAAVSTYAHPFQTTSNPSGTRSISWLGAFNTPWFVDFGNDITAFSGIQGLGQWTEAFRASTRYNEHLKCIDPQDTDLPSTQQ